MARNGLSIDDGRPSGDIAVAADYAEALLAARRAKNWLFVILLVLLIDQLAIFFVGRYAQGVLPDPTDPTMTDRAQALFRYWVGMSSFVGLAASLMLTLTLLLIFNVMLVGRLIGLANTTRAVVGSMLLCVLLFPWQAFLFDWAFKIPGVLYTWQELVAYARFGMTGTIRWDEAALRWARFVFWPVVSVAVLFYVQARSGKALRQALGEEMIRRQARDLERQGTASI